jgi:hypothetical protein
MYIGVYVTYIGVYVMYIGVYVMYIGVYVVYVGVYVVYIRVYVMYTGVYVMYIGVYVMCPLSYSDFSETCVFSVDFRKKNLNKFYQNTSIWNRVVSCRQT